MCRPGSARPRRASYRRSWRGKQLPSRGTFASSAPSWRQTASAPSRTLEIRTDGGGLILINVHGPQAGCSPWAGRAAFWADIQMYATARSPGGRHPVVIAGDTNIYMDVPANPATEHFRAGWEACGFRRAAAGGEEDMTPTLDPSRHRVDTFLVNEPLLLWSLRESVWARGMAHPQGLLNLGKKLHEGVRFRQQFF